jgi:[protein-PII] uridylyltransferase
LLLEKVCCALASEQINILSADLFTRTDGIVVNIFRVCTTNFEPVSEPPPASVSWHLRGHSRRRPTNPRNTCAARVNFLKPRTDTTSP